MRVLVSAVGTRGDVQPALALARELAARGAGVRLAIPPNFLAWAADLSLEARALGIEMRAPRGGTPLSPPTPEQLRQLGLDLIQGQFDVVTEAAEGCDAIVAAGAHQYAARSVAELRGIPCFSAVYAPVSLPTPELCPVAGPDQSWAGELSPEENRRRWAETQAAWNARALERVNQGRARLGLDPVDDVLSHILSTRTWLAADPTLGPAPATPGRGVWQPGAWLLPDHRPLPAKVEAFLDAGDPPIYLGFGSMPAAKDASRPLLEAARALGRRAILGQGWAELELVDAGRDCIAVGDLNHAAIFPRLAAVVHHGGAGTTTSAARAGLPQVLVPMSGDQPYWAWRVQQLGLGRSVEFRALSADSLAIALQEALEPEGVARARALADRIVPVGAARAARAILEASRLG